MAFSNFLIRPPAELAKDGIPTPGPRRSAQQSGALAGTMATAMAGAPNGAKGANGAISAFAAVLAGKGAEKKPGMERFDQGDASTLQLRNPVLAGRSPGDMIRAQAFSKAQTDLRQTQAMEGLMQSLGGSDSPLDLARNMGAARHLRSLAGGPDSRMRGLAPSDFIHTRSAKRTPARTPAQTQTPAEESLGKLSARFESGSDGVGAVGYDRNGGTSYGKYQVASRVGSMSAFLDFLDDAAPDISERLRKAGPLNTGNRQGAVPDTWRAIAKEQPERFEDLQESFIRESHYKPAVEAIAARTGLNADTLSPAMREVIWSTSVQHGPTGAARLFDRADEMSGKPTDPGYERKLISNVYTLRAGQFGSSTDAVRASVQNRFRQEKTLALNMLDTSRSTVA